MTGGRFSTIVILLVVTSAAAAAPGEEWRDRIETALARKNTYEFKEMALADLVKEIAGDARINIILDSDAGGVSRSRKITIGLTDVSYESIITWVSRAAGLEWVIQDEAVFIAPSERLDEAGRRQLERRARAMRARAEKTWLPALREALSKPHKFKLRPRPVAEAAESLEDLLGVNVVVSPEVSDRTTVSLAVSEMSGENIIAWIARKAGIDYAILNEAVYLAPAGEIRELRIAGLDFSSRGRPWDEVTCRYENVPFREVINDLSEKSGVEIVLQSEVGDLPPVTFSADAISLMEALPAITRSTGLNTLVTSEQGIVYISVQRTPREPAAPQTPAAKPGEDSVDEPAAPAADASSAPEGASAGAPASE